MAADNGHEPLDWWENQSQSNYRNDQPHKSEEKKFVAA